MDFYDLLNISIGKGGRTYTSKPDKNPDPLSYDQIWNSDKEAFEQTAYSVEQPGLKTCTQSTDCGSNHSCARGVCVPNNTVSVLPGSGGTVSGGGGSTGNTGCDQEETQPGAKSCKKKECSEEANCGDGAELFDPCCGEQQYRCGPGPDAPIQCEPCRPIDFPEPDPEPVGPPEPPDAPDGDGDDDDGDGDDDDGDGDDGDGDDGDGDGDDGDGDPGGGGGVSDPNRACSTFCDDFFKANGSSSASCRNKHCGQCATCSNGNCAESDDAPCYCSPGNSGCPDCSACDGGVCKTAKGLCSDECECEVKCCEGGTRRYRHSQDHYAEGTCQQNCRKAAHKYWCEKKKAEVCPPNVDPCAPETECEKDCECTSQKTACGGTYKCPEGRRCKVLGKMFAATGPDGSCQDGGDPTGAWSQGGMIWFLRVCTPDRDKPECEECDCNCENDCPDCYLCGSDGECYYDEECDEVCENEPCEGACCAAGESCVPGVTWAVTDPCHNQSYQFVAPQGVKPELVHTTDIEKESAVCFRFHTHCNVVVCGRVIGTHLDCQKGLKRVGASGSKTCSCA